MARSECDKDIETLIEIWTDYKNIMSGKIYVWKRKLYMGRFQKSLKEHGNIIQYM